MVRRSVDKRSLPEKQGLFLKLLLTVILLPIVLVLTKIGEITVRLLRLLSWLVLALGRRLFQLVWSVCIPSLRMITFSFLRFRLPHTRLLQKRHERPKIIYPIPLRLKARYFLLGALVATLIFVPITARLWFSDLPNPNEIQLREPALTTKIYDRSGKLLFQFFANENRSKVSLDQIPKHLIDATIAIEDKNFYVHRGFNLEAIARAARETFINKNLQGGSTITQQLIKSTLLTPQVTLERKTKEILLAFLAERIYTKNEILEMYLNLVPYGGTAWGIEAASETYFGKSVKDLTLAESALLAGLPSGPTLYSPFGSNPNLAKERQLNVLNRMALLGFITHEEAQAAYNEPLSFATPTIAINAPHFVMFVKDWLVRRYGIGPVEQGGLRVITTLDLDLQEQTQEIVRGEIEKLKPLSVDNGAALITNPQTGEILAMVGSRDYFDKAHDGNVNVTTALRQPGSSIKLVTYAAALEKGLTAASVLDDSPITYKLEGSVPYSPVNYDSQFHGKITLREAFGNSYNVPAVKTLSQIGIPTMIDMGKRLGITTWDDEERFGLALTLGGGEVKMTDLATVYGSVATGGTRHELTPILRVTNAQGEVLEEKSDLSVAGQRVLSEGIAFILSDILADNNARANTFGTNSILNIPGKRVSVKTGTSDNKRDNWTIGFTTSYVVAVWVGNNDNRPMHPSLTSGITGAAPIWSRIMTTAIADKPDDTVVPPTEVVAVPVCRINGLLPCGGCPTQTEYFVEGTQPKLACRPDFLTPAPAIGGADPTGALSN